MRNYIFSALLPSLLSITVQAQLFAPGKTEFPLQNVVILTDTADYTLIQKSAELVRQDIEKVTGYSPRIIHNIDKPYTNIIVIGTITRSALLKELAAGKELSFSSLANQWEGYQVKNIVNPFPHIKNILTLAGSDRRGTAYAVFEFSKQLGVSPWYWWADVPVTPKKELYINTKAHFADAPKVKYRGLFINDEAPCLSNWSKEQFGGFNHLFYEKVFELMLRLKANYLWPAMWGNAFYDDDSLNRKSADEYGIVIGTSHHEPLMRAHDEWRRYGKGKWNYDSNEVRLKEFWKLGMQRAWNEKIVSVGMRGDGDEPMSRETATALLERIVKDQREIITSVTGQPAEKTPQLWALYKEVQDYYDKGMRVPDDVTLLLCDDNWGNLRKLPHLNEKPRKGGYGIYYHFDYVGGPRNYKWINTNHLPRIWEQMHLAWEYKARDIWIVNVGDIKPMELPISFFLDYAWNPERIGPDQLQSYTENWALQQFGSGHAKRIAEILSLQGKYMSRRKPEMLNDKTFNLASGEFEGVRDEYLWLAKKTDTIYSQIDPAQKSAFFQLVAHPVKAAANLYELYYQVARNKEAFGKNDAATNYHAEKAKTAYLTDSLLTFKYHALNNGKWNHMMSQTHIGYTYWQQPPANKLPELKYLPGVTAAEPKTKYLKDVMAARSEPDGDKPVFYQIEESGVSIEAAHYTRAISSNAIHWKVLPDHGRTEDAITTFPVTAEALIPGGSSPHLEYDFFTYSKDSFTLKIYLSPTLNFHNKPEGLQFAVSIDNETPRLISLNAEDKNSISGIWNKWVSENIIIKTSRHSIPTDGKHTLKYWMVDSGVVLQKLVLDFGDTEDRYLGSFETMRNN